MSVLLSVVNLDSFLLKVDKLIHCISTNVY